MPVFGVMPAAPPIGTRSTFHVKEKGQEQPQLYVVPGVKNRITKEDLQDAVENALKTLPPASERETANLYPSAPNGESLCASTSSEAQDDKKSFLPSFSYPAGKATGFIDTWFGKSALVKERSDATTVAKEASKLEQLPIAGKPWTAEQIKKLLDKIPAAQRLFNEGWHLEDHLSAEKSDQLSDLFSQGSEEISNAEILLDKALQVTLAQEKTGQANQILSTSAFTKEESEKLENVVQILLNVVNGIEEASKGLYQKPDLTTRRFLSGLTLGIASIASLSIGIALFAAHIVTVVPLVFSLGIACASLVVLIRSYLYENEVEAKGQKWKRHVDALDELTKQLKTLQDNEMMQRINGNTEAIQSQAVQQNQAVSSLGQTVDNLGTAVSAEIEQLKTEALETRKELVEVKSELQETRKSLNQILGLLQAQAGAGTKGLALA